MLREGKSFPTVSTGYFKRLVAWLALRAAISQLLLLLSNRFSWWLDVYGVLPIKIHQWCSVFLKWAGYVWFLHMKSQINDLTFAWENTVTGFPQTACNLCVELCCPLEVHRRTTSSVHLNPDSLPPARRTAVQANCLIHIWEEEENLQRKNVSHRQLYLIYLTGEEQFEKLQTPFSSSNLYHLFILQSEALTSTPKNRVFFYTVYK